MAIHAMLPDVDRGRLDMGKPRDAKKDEKKKPQKTMKEKKLAKLEKKKTQI
jgi:hypothetical protein